MAEAATLQEFLASKPLLSYQLDATHLLAVVQALMRQQQQQQQESQLIIRRLTALEAAHDQVRAVVVRLEGASGLSQGVQEEIRTLKSHLVDASRALDGVVNTALPDIQRRCDEATKAAQNADHGLASVMTIVSDQRQGTDQLRRELQSISESHRAVAQQVQQDRGIVDTKERQREARSQQLEDATRDIIGRLDRMEREGLARLPAMFAELTARTDDNFHQVEISARSVDAELAKLRTDLANTRAELNTVDNDAAHRLAKLKDDVDTKFAMLLQLMQNFERNSMAMEQHVEQAGRVLANPRSASMASLGVGAGGGGYGGAGGGLSGGTPYDSGLTGGSLGARGASVSSAPGGGGGWGASSLGFGGGGGAGTTTTTTLGRDGGMVSSSTATGGAGGGARRNVAYELDPPGSAGSLRFGM